MNHKGRPRFFAYSAGSHPSGRVRPEAIDTLLRAGVITEGLHSKSWDEFAAPGAPVMDFVFTVCDNAAHEICPIWPGHPASAHWGIADPAAVQGSPEVITRAFRNAFVTLERRIDLFLNLPIASLDGLSLKKELDSIGKQ